MGAKGKKETHIKRIWIRSGEKIVGREIRISPSEGRKLHPEKPRRRRLMK